MRNAQKKEQITNRKTAKSRTSLSEIRPEADGRSTSSEDEAGTDSSVVEAKTAGCVVFPHNTLSGQNQPSRLTQILPPQHDAALLSVETKCVGGALNNGGGRFLAAAAARAAARFSACFL